MRRAFSTLGCPELDLDDVVDLARRTGWTGVELRTAPDDHVHIGLDADERRTVRRRLTDVTPVCLATYVRLGAPDVPDADVVDALVAHSRLAADLDTPAIRVFPGWLEGTDGAAAVGQLDAAADRLADGIDVWVETHSPVSRGRDVAGILDAVDQPRVQALWDLAHPWIAGEAVADTAKALGPRLGHVQIKDAASTDDLTPVFLGTGVIPLTDALAALDELGYDGWISLEWERKWYPQAAPLGQALEHGSTWLASIGR